MLVFSKLKDFSFSDLIETAELTGAFLLVDKAKNWTSFDVVAKLRSLTHIKKIGHAGTLDPLATGLLIVGLGKKATTKIDTFSDLFKSYFAVIKLGATTVTDDAEGEELIRGLGTGDLGPGMTEDRIKDTLHKFIGKIEQIPPAFSARKIAGTPAYKLARKNKQVELKPKEIEIYSIDIDKIDLPFITLNVYCSKGTYIRSLARDIGNELGCGAYLYNLRRTKIGDYSVDMALGINDLIEKFNNYNNLVVKSL